VKFPTGGDDVSSQPATPDSHVLAGLTWCKSKADGIVRMEEGVDGLFRRMFQKYVRERSVLTCPGSSDKGFFLFIGTAKKKAPCLL